jgi:hypothetical protein
MVAIHDVHVRVSRSFEAIQAGVRVFDFCSEDPEFFRTGCLDQSRLRQGLSYLERTSGVRRRGKRDVRKFG